MHRQVGRDLLEQLGDLCRVGNRGVDGDVRQVREAQEVERQDVGFGDGVGNARPVAAAGEAFEPAAREARPGSVLVEVPRERVDRGCPAVAKHMEVQQLVLGRVITGKG